MKAILLVLTMVLAAQAQAVDCKSKSGASVKIIKEVSGIYVEVESSKLKDVIFTLSDEEQGSGSSIDNGKIYSVATTENDAYDVFGIEIEPKGKAASMTVTKLDNESMFPIIGLVEGDSVVKTLLKEEITCDTDLSALLK